METLNSQLSVPEMQELENFINKIKLLEQLYNQPVDFILEKAITTFFAKTLKPRLKDYPTIYIQKGKKISGYSRRLAIKGKKTWEDGSHGMLDNVEAIFYALGSEYITKNIIKSSVSLVETTLNEVLNSSNSTQSVRYAQAIYQENFIYMMLQMAVKLIALDLYNGNLESENRTLNYMTQMIENDKEKIVRLFDRISKKDEDIHYVIQEYYVILDKYFDDFLKRKHTVTGEEFLEIGKEQQLLELLGETNVLIYIGYLIAEIQENLHFTKPMFKEKAITIK